jgi:hypothetical protein
VNLDVVQRAAVVADNGADDSAVATRSLSCLHCTMSPIWYLGVVVDPGLVTDVSPGLGIRSSGPREGPEGQRE